MGTSAFKISSIDKPDIVKALEREGVVLLQRGNVFWASCPLHNESTPSFKVDPGRQTFYCFGCHRHGDVITFVRERHGLSFKEAVKYLGMETNVPEPALIAEARERRELILAFRTWEKAKRDELAALLRACRQVIASKKPLSSEPEIEALALLQGEVDYAEYIYDILCGRDDRDKYELFEEEFGYGE